MNIIKHKYGKRTLSLLLAVILVLCPLQVRAADNKPTIGIGDYIRMGTYEGKPIVWRCVAKDSNGPLMLSDRVLCDSMPYDAKTNKNSKTGSHRRNSWRDNFGSNHWRDSNIRSWLNSNAEAGKVEWLCGNPPTADSVYPANVAYDQKEGFLRSFRSDELGAIRTVKQRSIVSHPEYTAGYIDAAGVDLPYNTEIDTVAEGYDSAYYEDIWDRVFLLDIQQLKTVNDNLNGYHIAQNRSNVAWNYWLRTPITTCNHDMRYVTPQGNILRDAPYKGYYGVRPAFYLNTENYTVSSGTGKSAQDPYVVSAPNAPDYSIGISGAVREDVNGDWNVNTDEYLQLEMSTYYTTDPAYANVTVPVYTIQKPRSDKENMVILYCAEGYTKSQQKQFIEDVKNLWGEVLQTEPYRSMADRFNVYALCTASVDGFLGTSTFFNATKNGISGSNGAWRNHILERIIGPAFIEKIHDAHITNKTRPNENPGDHDYRQYDYVYENINQFVLLANSGEYFGGSHDNKESGIHYIIASARSTYSAFTQRHELGHGLFHLGDEYNYSTDPVSEENYTKSLNMTATKDPTKVKWKQLLGFRNTYTCPHYDYYPYTYNSSRDCLMRETFQNDFCDVCKLQGMKVMSQLIKNPPALYVAVPEVKKYIGNYKDPTKDPSAFEAANISAYASYKNDRNSRLLSGGSKNSFDYSSMKGQQVELRTIIQNLSDTKEKKVTLRLWVEHSNGEKAVTTDEKQVLATKEFEIPVWSEKRNFWPKGALNYEGSDFNSGLVNCSLVYRIPENAILKSGDTIGFDIVDKETGEVLANDDTEKQTYADVTIQYKLEDGTDVPNTMPTTFTVPVGKRVDWQPPQELHSYTLVKAEGIGETVPEEGMTISYIYKRSDERPNPPVTKNYTVQYNWGTEFPEGKTPPQNNKSYPSEQQARDAVDTEYTSTTSIKGQKGGKNGTWTFSGWDTGRLINDTTVVFSGSWSFTADTAPITPPSGTASYKITATAGIGGTISPGGTTTVSAAGQLTYTIKANEGYYIADVKVDGSEVTATTSYTFSDVNTDHTIEVTFKQESQTPDVPDVIAPSITTQPGNATVKVGETASFTIAASGTDLTYQWQIDRNDGKGWVNIDGATATSYTTSTVNISCNGFKYKCVVSNSAGNVESNSATLTVQDAGGSDNPDTPNNTYQIIDGANSSWTHDSDGNITIRGNGDFSKFTGVKVDGNLIDKSNYTAKEGSTIITLKASYLNTLSAGNHTVEILWTDGSASTTFTTKANISDNSNNNQNDNNNSNSSDDKPSSGTDKKDVTAPKTGDNTPSVWLFILSVLSGTGLIITVKKRRENLNS